MTNCSNAIQRMYTRDSLLQLVLADWHLALVEGAVVTLLLPGPGVQCAQGAVVAHAWSPKAVVIIRL